MSARELTTSDIGKPGLHEWLAAHDLDPRQIAPGLVVCDGRITATRYVTDEQGNRQYERDHYDGRIYGVQTVVVDIDLRVPLPAHLGTVIE